MNPEVTKIGNKLFDKVELASQKVELALGQDLMSAEENLKNALLNYGKIKDTFEKAKNDFKTEADKAYKIAIQYNSSANELGLKAIDNPSFKLIDTYLASPLYKNLNK
jgi:prefoldin subunit 5